MDNQLRGDYVRTAVINQKKNLIAPIDIVNVFKDQVKRGKSMEKIIVISLSTTKVDTK